MFKHITLTGIAALSIGLSACDSGANSEQMEGGGAYPSPTATLEVAPPPSDPAATQAVNEAENLAPMSDALASAQAIPTPVPGSRTGTDVAELQVDEIPESGSGRIIGTIAAVAILGALMAIGAVVARRRGHLQSRASQFALVAAVAVLAAIVWLVPGIFPLL